LQQQTELSVSKQLCLLLYDAVHVARTRALQLKLQRRRFLSISLHNSVGSSTKSIAFRLQLLRPADPRAPAPTQASVRVANAAVLMRQNVSHICSALRCQ